MKEVLALTFINFCSIIKRRPLQGEWCDCMEDNPQLD